ncbi:MAG TPA: SoxR reducing system RseC family protein [Zoogloea sp.]|uniref:SoxR reducing system RseC family protein n=1 Tax=Zoogloea sp. TaxID=49181 RepID=UPI002CFCDA70|nr:SoxR reducing system RseC family protein [Zoogloea sp.]HMV63438.1 SoxR reducing system RseC family protein [Rhodocyclaceae bacterium]HMW53550.1 SoxR reducing system RseC family protein [Rhodocyclaceae bacterium]HNA68468.1 SoxR reducing system RseC family protein [Rhodocyclaceae bacterium]HND25682.1 SoxR reducing system RseC family protein [Rhodocyclaceae bacterium]HNI47853.1 SoxR reducing system RseC family protein [Zoogloea sp.]
MSSAHIEHRGVVRRVAGGKVFVAMETSGCASCDHGAGCGVGRLAQGQDSTLLTVRADADYKAGDAVQVTLPERGMTLFAMLGYLFPAFVMMLGAALGMAVEGSDAAAALGAMGGFLGAMLILRILISLMPDLMPTPQLSPIPLAPAASTLSPLEFHHDRHDR